MEWSFSPDVLQLFTFFMDFLCQSNGSFLKLDCDWSKNKSAEEKNSSALATVISSWKNMQETQKYLEFKNTCKEPKRKAKSEMCRYLK